MTPIPRPDTFRRARAGSLPIFRQDHCDYVLFYAPGYLAVVEPGLADAFETDLGSPAAALPAIVALRRHAAQAEQAWAELETDPFAPVCLTLYLNNECNLGCRYCYAAPTPKAAPRLDLETIRAGARLVAGNCKARNCRFTVVFHGGGEPTLNPQAASEALAEVERAAQAHGLELFRYVATNGVMPAARARWLAQCFDLIGLSCDGPPSIQARQRPMWGGGNTSAAVERTARIVRESGKPLHVRVTMTPDSLNRQAEIAEYICCQLKPEQIRVEAIYQAGRAGRGDCLERQRADIFVSEFLKARKVALGYGIPWEMSGSRIWEVHGPYCNVFRQVLNLVPGGAATACFKTTTADQARAQGLAIGELAPATGAFTLESGHIQNLRRALRRFPSKCTDCFNQYHCVRDCPSYCPLEGTTPTLEFACQAQQTLVNALLHETAARLRTAGEAPALVAGAEVPLL